MSGSYQGACFCGAVEIEVTGQPNAMGYCHCRSCRWWSGGPVNAFTLWAPEAVKVTKGEQHIGTYHKTEVSYRQFCQLCGGHLMTRHPPLSMIDVFASINASPNAAVFQSAKVFWPVTYVGQDFAIIGG